MTLHLTLPPELETRLRTEAERRGEPTDVLAVRLLDQHLPAAERTRAAIEMLTRWASDAGELSDEEAEANAGVLKALDADRPSNRSLFGDLAGPRP
jgi:hypothetical protein